MNHYVGHLFDLSCSFGILQMHGNQSCLPKMKSVRDQAVPEILPMPATWVVGMYDDIIASVTPWVVAM